MGHQFFELFFFSSVPGRRRRLPRRRASAPLLFSLTFSLQLHNQPINQNNDRGRPDASVHQDRSGEAGQAAAPPGVQGAEVRDIFFFFFFRQPPPCFLFLSLFSLTHANTLSPPLFPSINKQNNTNNNRDKKKAEILASRRAAAAAPRVVGVLPLSASAAAAAAAAAATAAGGEGETAASARVWAALVGACLGGGAEEKILLDSSKDAMEAENSNVASSLGPDGGPMLLPLPGSGASAAPRLFLLPPLRTVEGPSSSSSPAPSFDPLAVVDLVKACDVLLLVADASSTSSSSSGDEEGSSLIDAAGEAALSVARALGAPLAIGVAVLSSSARVGGSSSSNDLKNRAAAKKRLAAALERHLPGREPRIAVISSSGGGGGGASSSASLSSDASALARTIADVHAPPPPWRRQRPSLLIERASFVEKEGGGGGGGGGEEGKEAAVVGELTLCCHVRGGAGLAAASLVHVPGCGDFQVERILAAAAPRSGRAGGGGEGGSKQHGSNNNGTAAMEGTTASAVVLASVPPEEREPLVREAAVDDGDAAAAAARTDNGESFPAVEDMAAVEYALAAAAAGFPEQQRAARAARKLPAGTSEYQAAWLLDDDDEEGDSDDEEGDFDDEFGGEGAAAAAAAALPPLMPLPPSFQRKMDAAGKGEEGEEDAGSSGDDDRDGAATFAGGSDDDDESGFGGDDDDGAATTVGLQEQQQSATLKAAWRDQAEDARFPDEMDTPMDLPARLRFSKYRGLKSWRASRWSPADGAPPEFRRVFAFEAPKRARRRAVALAAAAGNGTVPGVPSGSRVDVVLCGVPRAAAEGLIGAVEASMTGKKSSSSSSSAAAPSSSSSSISYPTPPVVATGLLQHEGRLSVMHWAVRKSASFDPPIRSKDELLFADGVRRFSARPVFSGDDHGASHFKLERFLQPGRACVASGYAPIAHGPLPLLAFKKVAAVGGEGGGESNPSSSSYRWQLAAAGGVRGADPDRVILKKVVLSGYPVKVHKRKAVVRWMFHDPADVRWFRPVELWSKGGRRGRIKEPVGTHGAMKCVFDGAMSQADGVCLSLYKRQAPKWPPAEDLWVG